MHSQGTMTDDTDPNNLTGEMTNAKANTTANQNQLTYIVPQIMVHFGRF